jgi:tRNA (guanine37-N1)-methyltransferase
VTHQISLGDFVLSGGEIAAMALLDATSPAPARRAELTRAPPVRQFQPALDGLLDLYTRPERTDTSVPAVLMSGPRTDQALAA